MDYSEIFSYGAKIMRNPRYISKVLDYRGEIKASLTDDVFIPEYEGSDLEHVFIDTELSEDQVISYLEELRNDSLLSRQHQVLSQAVGINGYRAPVRGLALYVLVRHYGLEKIVETGSYFGQSTLYILLALDKNGKGVLHSFDAHPNDVGWYPDLPDDFELGYIVPDSLKDKWELHEGDINETLERGMEEIGEIDIFFHDSNHSEEHKNYEFDLAQDYLKDGGILASHDVGHGNVSDGAPATDSFNEISEKLDSEIYASRDFEPGDDGPRVFAFLYFDDD
jgi:predicted O-methyltransferase YrrM